MASLRPLFAAAIAGALLMLTGCSTPPPPRPVTHTVFRLNTALLIAATDGSLTAEQLQAKRDDIVRYLTERGLLSPDETLVSNAAAADRIVRVTVDAAGNYQVTVFNPGNVGSYYSAPSSSGSTSYRAAPTWPDYDPFFDFGYYFSPWGDFGYNRYYPRDGYRPHYPPGYVAPLDPRQPPPVVVSPAPPPKPRPAQPGDRRRWPRDDDRDHDGLPDFPRRNHPPTPDQSSAPGVHPRRPAEPGDGMPNHDRVNRHPLPERRGDEPARSPAPPPPMPPPHREVNPPSYSPPPVARPAPAPEPETRRPVEAKDEDRRNPNERER